MNLNSLKQGKMMIKYKLFTRGLTISLLAIGLTSCYLDAETPQYEDYYDSRNPVRTKNQDQNQNQDQALEKAQAANSANSAKSSKEPVQRATPGPKRPEAPQLPVIQ